MVGRSQEGLRVSRNCCRAMKEKEVEVTAEERNVRLRHVTSKLSSRHYNFVHQ
jgi:hypothetical protein